MDRFTASPADIDTRRDEIFGMMARLQAELAGLDKEFTRRGGWTRAYAVPGGHIHSSVACSTLYPTTVRYSLPQVSGMTETEIVNLAGERACTVCYPSAPVDVLRRACKLFTADEEAEREAKDARAQELAAKKAVAASKAITRPDGSPLRNSYGVIRTETAAKNEVLKSMNNLLFYSETHGMRSEWVTFIDQAIEALAHKQNRTQEEVRTELQTKAEKKFAKDKRDFEREYGTEATFGYQN